MVEIYIPYVEKFADWNELRYALRSIEKNLKCDYEVTLIGDRPGWIKNINYIEHRRQRKTPFPSLHDVICKLYEFINTPSRHEDYILWYDDIYLLREIDESWFNTVYALYRVDESRRLVNNRYQTERVMCTYDELLDEFVEIYNHETHLPRRFNKQRVFEVFKKYPVIKKRLLMATLYYTNFRNDKVVLLHKDDGVKAGFYKYVDNYGFNKDGNIDKICAGKTFLNHSGKGLSMKIKRYLEMRYPDKSSFEK